MEYGNMLYMGAAPSTLAILDKIQESAMKMGGFKIESLSSRREAAAVAFALRGCSMGSAEVYYKNSHRLWKPFQSLKKSMKNPLATECLASISKKPLEHKWTSQQCLDRSKDIIWKMLFWSSTTILE